MKIKKIEKIFYYKTIDFTSISTIFKIEFKNILKINLVVSKK